MGRKRLSRKGHAGDEEGQGFHDSTCNKQAGIVRAGSIKRKYIFLECLYRNRHKPPHTGNRMPGYRCLLVCAMPGPYPATPNKGGRVLVQWMAKRQVVRFVRARVRSRSRSRSTNPDRHVGPARHTRKILATATGSPILMRTPEILTLACLLASLAGCAIAPADKSFSMPSLIGLGVADPSFRRAAVMR